MMSRLPSGVKPAGNIAPVMSSMRFTSSPDLVLQMRMSLS